MPHTADIPAPIAGSNVRLGRYLSVHRHTGMAADHAILYIVAGVDQAVADSVAEELVCATDGPVDVRREPIGIDQVIRDQWPSFSSGPMRQLSNHLIPVWGKT